MVKKKKPENILHLMHTNDDAKLNIMEANDFKLCTLWAILTKWYTRNKQYLLRILCGNCFA